MSGNSDVTGTASDFTLCYHTICAGVKQTLRDELKEFRESDRKDHQLVAAALQQLRDGLCRDLGNEEALFELLCVFINA